MNWRTLNNKLSIPFLLGCLTTLILALLFSGSELEKSIGVSSSKITSKLSLPKISFNFSDFSKESAPNISAKPNLDLNIGEDVGEVAINKNENNLPNEISGNINIPNLEDLGLTISDAAAKTAPPNSLKISEDNKYLELPVDPTSNLEPKLNLPKLANSVTKNEEFLEYEGIGTKSKPIDSIQQKAQIERLTHFNSANQNINDFYFFDQQFLPKKYTPAEKQLLTTQIAEKTTRLNNNYQSYLQKITGREKITFQKDHKYWEEHLGLDGKFLRESYSNDLVLKNSFDKINERNILLTKLKNTSLLSSALVGVYSDGSGGTLFIDSAKATSFRLTLSILRNARYVSASEISGEASLEKGLGLFIKRHAKVSNPKQIETAKIFFKLGEQAIIISNSNTDYLLPLGVNLDGIYRKIFDSTGEFYFASIMEDQTAEGKFFMQSLNPQKINTDSNIQYQIGHRYLEGKELVRDYNKAFFWLQKSASNSNPLADFDLFQIYLYGLGQTKDEVSAAKHLDQARAANLSAALVHSGVEHLKGEIYPQNYQKALAELKQAKALNNPNANLMLALIYLNGFGVKQDIPEALKLLEIARNKNVIEAYSILGDIYQTTQYGIKDPIKSYGYYQKGYQAGNPNASLNYALLLIKSIDQPTQSEGLRILKYLAESEHPGALFHYANYLISKLGKEDSLEVPLDYLKKSASQGHIDSYYLLGVFYESPRLKNNYPKALHYYNKAILGNHPSAYHRLSELYREGKGVPRDLEKADWLLKKSIDFGSLSEGPNI